MSLRKVEKMQNFVVKRSIGNMCILKGVISSFYCGSIVNYIRADTPITKHMLVIELLDGLVKSGPNTYQCACYDL